MPMYCVCCYLCKNDRYKIMKNEKFIIYQMLPRIFGNAKANGGTGKFKDITPEVLEELKELNITHIWYTGIIKHSTAGERGVKGTAGSPYAINDYYDVNHYLASRKSSRMKEFEALVETTAQAGMGQLSILFQTTSLATMLELKPHLPMKIITPEKLLTETGATQPNSTTLHTTPGSR